MQQDSPGPQNAVPKGVLIDGRVVGLVLWRGGHAEGEENCAEETMEDLRTARGQAYPR